MIRQYTIFAAVGLATTTHYVDAYNLVEAMRVVRQIVGRRPHLYPGF